MKRDKIRKILGLFIVVLSIAVILIIFLRRTKINEGRKNFLSEGQNELHLVQTDGKKEIFELYAERHYPDKLGRFHLKNARIKIFKKAEGKDIVVKGDGGIYEKDLSLITIHNSEVLIEDLKIKSKELIYTSEGAIRSYYPAKFEHRYGRGEMDNFYYDLNKKTLIGQNFKGDFEKEENFHASADKIILSYSENSVTMEGNVFIKREDYDLKSERIYFTFSEGKIVYFSGNGNSEIIYYRKGEKESVPEIFRRDGEKVLKCQQFEIRRDGDFFKIKVENNFKLEFPAKNKGGKGSIEAQTANILYEREKGVKEAEAQGGFLFLDSDQKIEARNIYGKTDEESKDWEVVKAEGKVKFEGDVSFECGIFTKNKNAVLLEKGRPSVKRDDEMVIADKIEYNSEKKIMKGNGNVKAFLGEKSSSSTTPFFKKEKKIFAKADSIYFDEEEEIINLQGNASIEQEEQFLKSQNLLFERKKESFSTNKETQFFFVTKDEKISGSCNSMEYSKEKNYLILYGDSKLNTREYSMKGDSIKIGLDKEGDLNIIEGRAKVKFFSKEIEGEGEKFYLDLKNKKAIFEGNPSVKDEKRGKMRGRKIFIDLDTKEVKIEGNVSEVEIKEKKK